MKKSMGRIITCILICTSLLALFGCSNTTREDTGAVSGEVTPEIGAMSSLKTLSLENNQLTTLPPEIGEMPSLTRLVITGNPIPTLPESITNNKKITVVN